MDFAFAPGTTGQDARARAMFTRRAATTLVARARRRTAVRDFIARVDATHGAEPVDNLLIAAHANSEGVLFIPMFRGQRGPTDFETLEDTIATPAHSITIPEGIAPASFHIKGCNLGQVQPFLLKLKEALGDAITVTAPRHFHYLFRHTGFGVWEAMAYEFRLVRHPDDRFATRAEAVAAFEAGPFTKFDGSAITNAEWEDWIPRHVNRKTSVTRTEQLTNPVGARRTIPVTRQFRFARNRFTYTLEFPTRNDVPVEDGDRMAAFDEAIRADEWMDPGHPFPGFARWGYADIDDFIDGLEWRFGRANNRLVCTGTRLSYTVLAAVRHTSAAELDMLVSNFYPNAGSPHPAQTTDLDETDAQFFGST
jgi:hypothetical protein